MTVAELIKELQKEEQWRSVAYVKDGSTIEIDRVTPEKHKVRGSFTNFVILR